MILSSSILVFRNPVSLVQAEHLEPFPEKGAVDPRVGSVRALALSSPLAVPEHIMSGTNQG